MNYLNKIKTLSFSDSKIVRASSFAFIAAALVVGGFFVANSALTAQAATDSTLPVIESIITKDANSDGKVETATITFSESVDDSTFSADDFTIGSADGANINTGETDNDNTFDVVVESGIEGTEVKDVTYTATAGTESGADLAGNLLAGVVSNDVEETDGANPVFLSAETKTINTIDLTFSEDLDGNTDAISDFSVKDYTITGTDELINGVITLTLSSDFGTGETPDVSYVGDVADLASASLSASAAGPLTPTDGIAPTLTSVSSNAVAGGILKVGDTITFTVTPTIQEAGLNVSPATYNGEELSWSTTDEGTTYTATYTVQESQTDQTSALQLTGVTLTDSVGNESNSADGSGVEKTIDANTPDAPEITSIAGDGYINNSEKGAIHVVGTAEAGAVVNISLTDGNTIVNNSDTATAGGTYNITINGNNGNSLVDGTITPSVTATDAAGNVSDAVISPTAIKDVVAPDAVTISVDNGKVVTKDSAPDLTLALTVTGSTPDEMKFSCNNTDGGSWVDWSTSYSSFDITTTGADCSANEGTKTVYVEVKDTAGNIQSTEGSDAIIYDGDDTLTVDDSGGADFITIQGAIDEARADDTISVSAGTYTEQLTVDKSLILQGIDSPTIDVSDFGSSDGTGYGVDVTAPNVTIDGFEFIGIPYGNSISSDVNPTIDAEADHVTIQNCVFNPADTLDEEAMVARPGTNNISFLDNKVHNYMVGITARGHDYGGNAELPDDGVTNLTVAGNTFDVGYADTGSAIYGEAVQIDYGDNIVVTDNTINGPGTFESSAYSTYDWISSFGILDFMSDYGAMGTITYSNNEITNCYVGIDTFAGNGQISSNNISDNNIGIWVGQNDDVLIDTSATGVAIIENNVENNTRGIWAQSFVPDGIAAHSNNIVGNTEYGVINEDPDDVLNATKNWWGAADGPSGEGSGNGDVVSDNVSFRPWYTGKVDTTDLDVVAPTIISHTPSVKEVNVASTSNITITFSEPVVVEEGDIILDPATDFNISGSGTNEITLTPRSAWNDNTTYTVTVSANVADVSGNGVNLEDGKYSPWDFTTATSYNISLYGANVDRWNLISLPVVPNNKDISAVLSGVENSVKSVWTYAPGNPKADESGWLVYAPDNPEGTNSLTTMTAGFGYWIKATSDATISGSGSLLRPATTPPSRELSDGWNLIGYYQNPGEYSSTSGEVFLSLEGSYICGYNNSTGKFKSIKNTSTVEPGDAFWISLPTSGKSYTPSNQ